MANDHDGNDPLLVNNNNQQDDTTARDALLQRRRQEEMEQWLLQQEQAEQEELDADAAPRDGNEDDVDGDNREGDGGAEELEQQQQEQQQLALQQQLLLQQQQMSKQSIWFLRYRPASLLWLLGLVWYALRTRHQYYLAVVYLCSSKWAYVVIGNAVLASALTVFDVTVNIALRGLRLQEAESLSDFFRWNVTETCLALTMFRHELTVGTALQFVALVTVKCLHHVATQREQNLRMTQDAVQEGGRFPYICTGHLRVILFLCFLQAVDMMVVQYAAAEIFKSGPSVQILFAFEAAILLVSAWSHMVLWHLHVIDSVISYGHEHEWHFTSKLLHPWKDYKATLTFVVELQAQAVNFLFYSTFFAIVMTFYGPPLNLFREVYMSLAKLKERLTAFFNYRHLMASMNRFASATDEQLDEVGRTCIICRDEMCTTDCKRLPVCAHTFHKSCLREWLVQQQSCPTCRSDIAAMEAQEASRNATSQAAQERAATGAAPADQSVSGAGATGPVTADTEPSATTHPATSTTQGNTVAEDPLLLNESYRSMTSTATAGDRSIRTSNDIVGQPAGTLSLTTLVPEVEETIHPTLFEVANDTGIPVFDLIDYSRTTRTIDPGTIVLGLARVQRATNEDSLWAKTWLRIPDGWIDDDVVREVCPVRL